MDGLLISNACRKINEVTEFYNLDYRVSGTLQANTGWEMSLFRKWRIRNAMCLKYALQTGKGMKPTPCMNTSICQVKNSTTGKEMLCDWKELKGFQGGYSRKWEPHGVNQDLSYS